MKKLVLIDGNALVHRAYHALPRLTTPQGELINAAYGFTSILLKVLGELKPEYVAVTFDLAEPTFRHEEYKEYKATRPGAPQELYDQLERVKQITRALNIPIYEQKGYEADDVIGTIVQKEKEAENIIVTGDLDTLQLIDGQTKVYTPKKGLKEPVIYDQRRVKERYGLRPNQLIDFKGLKGDPSDNIPGVPGIGEKTAIKLLQEFNNLEKLYEAVEGKSEKLPAKLAAKLAAYKEQAFFSKYLATIRKDVPLAFDLEKCRLKDYNYQTVADLFNQLGFKSLIERLP